MSDSHRAGLPVDEMADWLAAIGFGFDFHADSTAPLPEPLRRPLAEAWQRREHGDHGSEAGSTVEDYYKALEEEGAW